MKSIIFNILICVVFEVLTGLLLPSGKLKNITLSVVSLYLFYVILAPVCTFLETGSFV